MRSQRLSARSTDIAAKGQSRLAVMRRGRCEKTADRDAAVGDIGMELVSLPEIAAALAVLLGAEAAGRVLATPHPSISAFFRRNPVARPNFARGSAAKRNLISKDRMKT